MPRARRTAADFKRAVAETVEGPRGVLVAVPGFKIAASTDDTAIVVTVTPDGSGSAVHSVILSSREAGVIVRELNRWLDRRRHNAIWKDSHA